MFAIPLVSCILLIMALPFNFHGYSLLDEINRLKQENENLSQANWALNCEVQNHSLAMVEANMKYSELEGQYAELSLNNESLLSENEELRSRCNKDEVFQRKRRDILDGGSRSYKAKKKWASYV